ncbi:MFS transporter [Streptomyces sp. NRRL F-4474]|uniref:MFS transporter n=1 Tax=Streptomyces sp. NRRL F-4474 TaxID=1463851 RepID=UPI001F322B6F|nr:MFS transporter [Streptomyces sp. NRRL F-4474]
MRHKPKQRLGCKATRPAGDTVSAETNLLTALGVSPTAFGVIMGTGGMGSLAGALLTSRMTDRFGVGPVIIIGFAVSPLAQVPLLLAGPGRGWQIVLAATLAAQLFWATAAGVSQRTLRQILCAPAFQGRMQAVSTTVTAGSRPLAAASAGALALVLDVPVVLAVGALLQIVPVLLLLASPVRALRTMPILPTPAAVPPA